MENERLWETTQTFAVRLSNSLYGFLPDPTGKNMVTVSHTETKRSKFRLPVFSGKGNKT